MKELFNFSITMAGSLTAQCLTQVIHQTGDSDFVNSISFPGESEEDPTPGYFWITLNQINFSLQPYILILQRVVITHYVQATTTSNEKIQYPHK